MHPCARRSPRRPGRPPRILKGCFCRSRGEVPQPVCRCHTRRRAPAVPRSGRATREFGVVPHRGPVVGWRRDDDGGTDTARPAPLWMHGSRRQLGPRALHLEGHRGRGSCRGGGPRQWHQHLRPRRYLPERQGRSGVRRDPRPRTGTAGPYRRADQVRHPPRGRGPPGDLRPARHHHRGARGGEPRPAAHRRPRCPAPAPAGPAGGSRRCRRGADVTAPAGTRAAFRRLQHERGADRASSGGPGAAAGRQPTGDEPSAAGLGRGGRRGEHTAGIGCRLPLGTLEYCRANGVQVQAWGALAQGRYTGRQETPDEQATARLVEALAKEKDTSPETILLWWLQRHPAGIAPVIGTARPERIRACRDAATGSRGSATRSGTTCGSRPAERRCRRPSARHGTAVRVLLRAARDKPRSESCRVRPGHTVRAASAMTSTVRSSSASVL